MTKIYTRKEMAEKKHLHPKRGDSMEDESEFADSGYLENLLSESRTKGQVATSDLGAEEKVIKENLTKMGVLTTTEGGWVMDNRITPNEERRISEFASHLTKGNPSLIVEMADQGYKVYNKEGKNEGTRNYVTEFAEYPRKKGRLEKGD